MPSSVSARGSGVSASPGGTSASSTVSAQRLSDAASW
jgi:hypothetical protein